MIIRPEQRGDEPAIRLVIRDAFERAPHSSGTESAIVDALRDAEALTVSLVAVDGEEIIGHVAVSPVTIGDEAGWFGVGPVAVLPSHQRRGAGAALIAESLAHLRSIGASGCVVLGEPGYYSRFGFTHDAKLTYGDVPPGYFQAISFDGKWPRGSVSYHRAFEAAA